MADTPNHQDHTALLNPEVENYSLDSPQIIDERSEFDRVTGMLRSAAEAVGRQWEEERQQWLEEYQNNFNNDALTRSELQQLADRLLGSGAEILENLDRQQIGINPPPGVEISEEQRAEAERILNERTAAGVAVQVASGPVFPRHPENHITFYGNGAIEELVITIQLQNNVVRCPIRFSPYNFPTGEELEELQRTISERLAQYVAFPDTEETRRQIQQEVVQIIQNYSAWRPSAERRIRGQSTSLSLIDETAFQEQRILNGLGVPNEDIPDAEAEEKELPEPEYRDFRCWFDTKPVTIKPSGRNMGKLQSIEYQPHLDGG